MNQKWAYGKCARNDKLYLFVSRHLLVSWVRSTGHHLSKAGPDLRRGDANISNHSLVTPVAFKSTLKYGSLFLAL